MAEIPVWTRETLEPGASVVLRICAIPAPNEYPRKKKGIGTMDTIIAWIVRTSESLVEILD